MSLTVGTPIDSTLGDADGSPNLLINLDTDKAAMIYAEWSGSQYDWKAKVVSASGTALSLGSATTILSGPTNINAGGEEQHAIKTATDEFIFFVVDRNYNESWKAVVCSASGTTISVDGTSTLRSWSAGNETISDFSVCEVDTDEFIAVYNDPSDGYTKATRLTRSGSSLTETGTPVTIQTQDSWGGVDCQKGTTDKALIWYTLSFANGGDLYGVVGRVSGSSVVLGTPVLIETERSNIERSCKITPLTDGYGMINFVRETGVSTGIYWHMGQVTGTDTFNDIALQTAGSSTVPQGNQVTAADLCCSMWYDGGAGDFTAAEGELTPTASPYIAMETETDIDVSNSGTYSGIFGVGSLGDRKLLFLYPEDTSPDPNFQANLVAATSDVTPPSSVTHLWLSDDGAATFTNIGDATWGTDLVGAVMVVPGTSFQTIYAAVGTSVYKTTNGGTSWSSYASVGYEVDWMSLREDGYLFVANRASGGNRASLIDTSGTVTHINTSKSTTGGATATAIATG